MATYNKVLLSGSTNGRPIKITTTASAGTTLHSTGTSSSVIDEIWLYGVNVTTTDVLLTVEYGGTTNSDDRLSIHIPSQSGLYLVLPGLVLTGTGSASSVVRAFAGTANAINIVGYVNRIS